MVLNSSSSVTLLNARCCEKVRVVFFFVRQTHFECFIFVLIEKEKYGGTNGETQERIR